MHTQHTLIIWKTDRADSTITVHRKFKYKAREQRLKVNTKMIADDGCRM